MSSVSWQPTATPETLRLRAELLSEIRRFFAERNVLEVETPALSKAGAPDPALELMTVQAAGLGIEPYYLHTSPEYAMKRLLASANGDIYQICRVFRDRERGRWHEPEFTLLEWYRVGWNEDRLMDEVESLLRALLERHRGPIQATRISYRDVFRDVLNVDPAAAEPELRTALARAAINAPADTSRDGLLDLALSQGIVPRLDRNSLSFIYDFPASQAALARIKPQDPPVAARFEAFSDGIELANGFGELTDATEQRQRFEAELAQRRRDGQHEPPLDERFLEALRHGLPACAGVAVGVDRLVALAAGLANIAETISFAHGLYND